MELQHINVKIFTTFTGFFFTLASLAILCFIKPSHTKIRQSIQAITGP